MTRVIAGGKFFIEAVKPSILVVQKCLTYSNCFDVAYCMLTNYHGLRTNGRLEAWVPRDLQMHRQWFELWKNSANRFAEINAAPFFWETPDEGGARGVGWRIRDDYVPRNMHEERQRGSEIAAAAACMIALHQQKQPWKLLPVGPERKHLGRLTKFLSSLLGPTTDQLNRWRKKGYPGTGLGGVPPPAPAPEEVEAESEEEEVEIAAEVPGVTEVPVVRTRGPRRFAQPAGTQAPPTSQAPAARAEPEPEAEEEEEEIIIDEDEDEGPGGAGEEEEDIDVLIEEIISPPAGDRAREPSVSRQIPTSEPPPLSPPGPIPILRRPLAQAPIPPAVHVPIPKPTVAPPTQQIPIPRPTVAPPAQQVPIPRPVMQQPAQTVPIPTCVPPTCVPPVQVTVQVEQQDITHTNSNHYTISTHSTT
jgi:hypothetical protein